MKIGFVSPYEMFRSGGVQSFIKDLDTQLQKLGHEVVIIAPGNGNGGRIKRIENVIQVGAYAPLNAWDTSNELSVARRMEINEIIDKEKFDLMHFHEPLLPFLPLQVLNQFTGPKVCTAYATVVESWRSKFTTKLMNPYMKGMMNSFEMVLTISTSPLKFLQKIYDGEIKIIPPGIDLQKFVYKPELDDKYKDGKINILFLGRLDTRKGVTYLLDAFHMLQKERSDVRLIIAGKGAESKKLHQQAKKLKLKNVEFLGFVSEEEKLHLYASCDIYCSPATHGESFGIVFTEAMAMGKPVVGTNIPGYNDVLVGPAAKMLVKPKDAVDLYNKLNVLCSDPDLRKKLSKWGLKEVRKYDQKRIAKEMEKVYQQAIANYKD